MAAVIDSSGSAAPRSAAGGTHGDLIDSSGSAAPRSAAEERRGDLINARFARAIFATTFAVYLLTSGREPPWGDANVQYMVAESLVRRGAIDIPKAWPDDLPRGRDTAADCRLECRGKIPRRIVSGEMHGAQRRSRRAPDRRRRARGSRPV